MIISQITRPYKVLGWFLRRQLWGLFSLIVYCLIIEYCYFTLHLDFFLLPFSTTTVLGTGLAILMGFRFQISYSRWWELRGLWSNLRACCLNYTRDLCVSISTKEPTKKEDTKQDKKELLHLLLNFIFTLTYRLEHVPSKKEQIKDGWPFSFESESKIIDFYQNYSNKSLYEQNLPRMFLFLAAKKLSQLRSNSQIDSESYARMNSSIGQLQQLQCECEKIKKTPIPYYYTYYLTLIIYAFSFLMPLGLVDQMGADFIFFTIFIYFIYSSLMAIAQRIETPFGQRGTDFSLTRFAESIKRATFEMYHYDS